MCSQYISMHHKLGTLDKNEESEQPCDLFLPVNGY